MVIERALEKLRETTAAKRGTRSVEIEASRRKSAVRPEARSTAIRLLPVVTPDVEAAEARRVLLPDASMGRDTTVLLRHFALCAPDCSTRCAMKDGQPWRLPVLVPVKESP